MANTTNYGWETPDDTDLVKDGAAAIRTLGSSIDTTTKSLNPETTLGDMSYRSSTANTNTRLPIGTNGQVLTVSSGVPTWGNASAGFKGVSLRSSGVTLSVADSTTVSLQFNTEEIDTDGFHSTTADTDRITIPTGLGGKYLIIANTYADQISSGYFQLRVYKNGATNIGGARQFIGYTDSVPMFYFAMVAEAVAGDYFTLQAYQTSGASKGLYFGSAGGRFQAIYLGA